MNLVQEVEVKYTSTSVASEQQLVNHLDSLGYLDCLMLTALNAKSKVQEAYDRFYADLKNSGLVSLSDLRQAEAVFGAESPTKLLELAIDVDEGFTFQALPQFGELNLQTRIIHYRLTLLGVYQEKVNLPYSALSYAALEKLASYLGKTKLAAINLAADLQNFTSIYLKANGYQHCLTVIKYPEEKKRANTSPDFQIPNYSGQFKRLLKQNLKNHESIFESIDELLFYRNDRKVNESFLDKLYKSELNAFTLRLILIHQWMSGFYNATLDNDFGALSLESLNNIIDCYTEAFGDEVKTAKLLVRINEDTLLFNALFFLQHYKEEGLSSDTTIATLNTVNAAYQNASDKNQQDFENNLNAEIGRLNAAPEATWQPVSITNKVFTGIKTFFKKIFKFAGKIFKWIISNVKKYADFVKNFIRNLYEYLKIAVRQFINGVKFLIGKLPVISTTSNGRTLYSNFDIDKDVVSLISTGDNAAIETHVKKVSNQVHGMEFSLSVISMLYAVLRTLLAGTAPIAMPVFLFNLAKAFKLVIDKYKLIVTI